MIQQLLSVTPSAKSGRSIVWSLLAAAALIGGCSSVSLNRAPVEDRGTPVGSASGSASTSTGGSTVLVGATAAAVPNKPLPGAENAGKPGYYTIRPGDTLIRIGLDTGQNWKDIARWNGMDNPNLIEVGQVVRVIPPGTADVTPGSFIPRPVPNPTTVAGTAIPPAGTRTTSAPTPAASASAATATAATPAATAPVPAASSAGDDDVAWIWPAPGAVIAGFDEAKNKGLDLSGKAGDPVLAAGDGRVVYAGAGLRGYGNLVILKHNNTYLTAYAHNQTLLVKEDQSVRKGQKIAEMGQSDADRVKLHFEIRRQGKPVDPARYLPAR
jgi:lipoprotein NlpD